MTTYTFQTALVNTSSKVAMQKLRVLVNRKKFAKFAKF